MNIFKNPNIFLVFDTALTVVIASCSKSVLKLTAILLNTARSCGQYSNIVRMISLYQLTHQRLKPVLIYCKEQGAMIKKLKIFSKQTICLAWLVAL